MLLLAGPFIRERGSAASRLAHPRLAPALVHPLTALGAGLLPAVKRFVNRLAVTIRYGPGRPHPRTHGPRRPWPNLHERGRGTPVGLDRGRRPPHLKIRHRLFAARCVAVIINRWRLLPRGYGPKPRLFLRACGWRMMRPTTGRVTKPQGSIEKSRRVRLTAALASVRCAVSAPDKCLFSTKWQELFI